MNPSTFTACNNINDNNNNNNNNNNNINNNNNNNNINIFNHSRPISRSCYQGVPWATKNRIKITFKVLKTLRNEVRDDIYNN